MVGFIASSLFPCIGLGYASPWRRSGHPEHPTYWVSRGEPSSRASSGSRSFIEMYPRTTTHRVFISIYILSISTDANRYENETVTQDF
ncbi:MAG: hypothetical protein QXL96_09790 [Ignisphaera sp.]